MVMDELGMASRGLPLPTGSFPSWVWTLGSCRLRPLRRDLCAPVSGELAESPFEEERK